jgi:hypothetical protein
MGITLSDGEGQGTLPEPPSCSVAPFVISPDGCIQIRAMWPSLAGAHDRSCMPNSGRWFSAWPCLTRMITRRSGRGCSGGDPALSIMPAIRSRRTRITRVGARDDRSSCSRILYGPVRRRLVTMGSGTGSLASCSFAIRAMPHFFWAARHAGGLMPCRQQRHHQPLLRGGAVSGCRFRILRHRGYSSNSSVLSPVKHRAFT